MVSLSLPGVLKHLCNTITTTMFYTSTCKIISRSIFSHQSSLIYILHMTAYSYYFHPKFKSQRAQRLFFSPLSTLSTFLWTKLPLLATSRKNPEVTLHGHQVKTIFYLPISQFLVYLLLFSTIDMGGAQYLLHSQHM